MNAGRLTTKISWLRTAARRAMVLAAASVLLSPARAAGQAPANEESAGARVHAVRLNTPLTLDGELDEAVYADVIPLTGFVQYEPRNGQPATEASEAWVLFDARNLYVAVRNWDSDPARMVANELRRDSTALLQNEQVTVTLDTFHDRRNGYTFLVNPLGGMLDEAFTDERNGSRDWNTVWDAKVSRFHGGWTVEIIIPFRSLRYRPGDGPWGIQIGRSIRWKNEITFLAPLPVLAGPPVYRVSYAATLTGLDAPPLLDVPDVKLTAAADVADDRTAVPGERINRRVNGSLDVKYPFARGLTADFTVNTDFAQVEEDEQQVNLTRFSLFFPEKREFFLEGQGVFNFGGQGSGVASDVPVMFFSRAIGFAGGRPQDILAGGRLTGKAGPYSIGLVNIQTRDEPVSGAAATNFSVVRVRRDILRNSAIGVLVTNRSRSARSAGGANVLGGVDGVFTFAQYLRINAYLARTRTANLRGNDWSYRGQVDYSHDRYGAAVERLKVGDSFNPEVGFMRRTDFTRTNATLRFSPRPAAGRALSRRVRKFSYEGAYSYYTGGDGRTDSYEAAAVFRTEFQKGDVSLVQYTYTYDRLTSPFTIAPGVTIPVGTYDWRSFQVTHTQAAQRRLSGAFTAQVGSFYSGTQRVASYRGRVAVARNLAIEPAVSVNWIDLPEGRFTSALVSTRVTVPMTPRTVATAFLQYNSLSGVYSASARFRWEYLPGSDLFVVYTEGRDALRRGFPDLTSRGLAVKVTRLLRM